ncbi:MAG: pilus assembly protein PilM [Muribaculaceae bacterium]|nr:pilus assembly protein PilM [Muribaculaceae bacterium]
MEPRSIVAIEISSSKIKGGVATVDASGVLTVLAVEEIKALNNVRYGRIQNVQEVSTGVNEIIRKLEHNPAVAPNKVVGVVVPVGGRSLGSIPATGTTVFPGDIEILAENVARLKQEALKDVVTNKHIEAVLPRTFYVNNVAVARPVGIYGQRFRGEFVVIAIGAETHRNLERVRFDNIAPSQVYPRLRCTAVADLVLTDSQRQLGCALVDFGAETVTVSVYKDGALCYLSTLPMGSRTITRDLMSGLSLTEDRAEEFKTTIGNAAMPDAGASAADTTSVEVNNFVHARAGEIAANIVHQIMQSGYKPGELTAGIVLTGGGARLRNFDNVLAALSKMSVRHASIPPVVEFKSPLDRTDENTDIVALLWAGARAAKVADCLEMPPRNTIVFGETEENDFQEEEVAEQYVSAPEPEPEDEPEPAVARPSEPAGWRGRSLGNLFGRKKQRRDNDEEDLLRDEPDAPEEDPEDELPENEPEYIDEEVEEPYVRPKAGDDPFEEEGGSPTQRRNRFAGIGSSLDNLTRKIGEFLRMPEEPDDPDYRPPM